MQGCITLLKFFLFCLIFKKFFMHILESSAVQVLTKKIANLL